MVGIDENFGEQFVEAVENRIGETFVETGKTEHRVCPLVDHVTHQRFVILEHQSGPADDLVDQRPVAAIGNHRLEHPAEEWRDLQLRQLGLEPCPDLRAKPFGIERFEHLDRKLARARTDARILRCPRVCEIASHRLCKIHRAHAPSDHRGGQEIVTQEARHGIGDAILVLGNDRRVRNRQAKRSAEQRGDRKPVCEPADHCRFGEGM